MSFWTEEIVESLRAMVAEGFSTGRIAREIGARSRNQVMGKIVRLGLVLKGKPGGVPGPRSSRASKGLRPVGRGTGRPLARRKLVAIKQSERIPLAPTLPPPIPLAIEQRRTVFELCDRCCRWPLWQKDADERLYCGATAIDGSPYCAGHHAIAFQPWRRRSDHQLNQEAA